MHEIDTADDYVALLDLLDQFVKTTGSAFGLTYAGTGNGTLTAYKGGTTSVAETFTITATSATNFTVVGSVSGSIGPATVGTPFSHAKIAFLISAGGTAFVSGDAFILSTAPKWTSLRRCLGCKVTGSHGTSGPNAAENVIDGKVPTSQPSDDWRPPVTAATLEFEFFESETIAEYAIVPGAFTSSAPKSWTFERWDGAAWVVLDTRTNETGWTEFQFRAYAVGTPVAATKYRLNITASNGPSDIHVGAVQLRRTVGGFDAAFSQVIWAAPGNDGDSQIYVGVHHFRRLDVDYHDWEVCTIDGFNANVNLYQQAGFHGRHYLPLWNAPIPYWLVVTGRGFRLVAKVDTQYEIAFAGFTDQFFTPAQLPYPAVVGGSLALGDPRPAWNDSGWRWSNSSNAHRIPTHSDPRSGSLPKHVSYYQLAVRRFDGVWEGLRDTIDDTHNQSVQAGEGVVIPYVGGLSLQDLNVDGSDPLWPVVLVTAAPNSMGRLEGVRAITGQGKSSESPIKRGVVDWLAFQNVTRADRDDWCAVEMD